MKKKILQASHVTKRYGNQTVIDDLNMTLFEGDIYGLIGKNGAGKTTLIRIIAGLARPTDGCLFLFGSRDLTSQRSHIGTVIGPPALYPNMTARENLLVQCKLLGITNAADHIRTVLMMTGLEENGKKKAGIFSSGMKQKLAIAIAMLNFPRLLILDEPANGLDPEGIRDVRELILKLNRKYNITVLISSHMLGELSRIATRFSIMQEGKLLDEFTEEDLWKRCRTDIGTENDLEEYFLDTINR